MIESRCGLLCSACSYRETNNCSGCVNVDTVFWGECGVKKCCESKELSSCGNCKELPCSSLHEFSYDKEHGDHGARIEQCKKWSSGVK
jgi:hypothetical protein